MMCQFINGDKNGHLHHKYHFVKTLRELGYRVPEQRLYDYKESSDLTPILDFQSQQGMVFCKPLEGSKGIGVYTAPDEEALKEFIGNQKEPYIIQEFLPPVKDCRYLYHVGPEKTFRACYEKHKPIVIGDGKTTLADLIEKEASIPAPSRKKIKANHKRKLKLCPSEGEVIALVASGNISQGAYGIILNDEEHEAIDAVILPLIKDLEEKRGIKMTTYCFDIGLLREVSGITPFTKNDIVFYEFQMPFDMIGYFRASDLTAVRKETQKMLETSFIREWLDRPRDIPSS
ncbi:MAG: hypothetical protein KUG82_09840 [Pseudomonadales bacterium]|nr:hypothetical protein [Pseudomonadales bacterium]